MTVTEIIVADSKDRGLRRSRHRPGTEVSLAPYAVPNGTTNLTDTRGKSCRMRFNHIGFPIGVTDPIGRTTLLTRDDSDLVAAVTATTDGKPPDGIVGPAR